MGKKSFAVELKSSRNALGLSQEMFAKKLGVSSLSVCMWENGKYEPQQSTMLKVKTALAKLGTAKPAAPVKAPVKAKAKVQKAKAPVKAPKAKAPVKAKVQKATKVKAPVKKKAPAKAKAPVLRVADVLAVITEIRNSVRDLDQKLDTLKTPTVTSASPVMASLVDVEPVAVPESEVILRKLVDEIKMSHKDGVVRGATRHVVEWPDICDTYYKALELLKIDK